MNNNKDLYEILGIDRNASDDEIKKSYKRLALRYHPDRQGGKSDAEKKEAEEKFKEIGFAYSILSDPEKKQRYDQFGITDDQQMNSEFDPSEIFKHFMGGFGGMFGNDDNGGIFGSFFGRNQRNRQPKTQKGQSVRMQLQVSIKDLLNGIHKDIKFDTYVRCEHCHGVGGEGVEICPHCHGTGMITETQRFGYQIMQSSHPCQYCNGTGKTIKNKCKHCNGIGLVKKETSVRLDIGPGFEDGTQLIFAGKGYESKNANGNNGDLVIVLEYNFDSEKYVIGGNCIYELVNIPYYDCILGKTYEHTIPNDEKVKIKIPQYCQEKEVIDTGKRYGMFKYCLVVMIKMPTYIRKSEKELLEKIRKENS